MRQVKITAEQWPLHEPFIISRLVQEQGEVVVVEISENGFAGRGECEYADIFFPGRATVIQDIEAVVSHIEEGCSQTDLQALMPAGPARNAIDCALWDLQAKQTGTPIHQLVGLDVPMKPVTTVFTISLDSPEKMAADAKANRHRPVLKLKIGRDGDPERVAAVRAAAPDARISVDANTGWSEAQLLEYMPKLAALGVELVEQPFKPGEDDVLSDYSAPIPLAADESCLNRASLPGLVGKYEFVNIKLDKTGGLTEALKLVAEAKSLGFGIMVGCNIGTSLAMAPGMIIAQMASFVDLDGPLLLSKDRDPCLRYDTNSQITPPAPELWG